MRAPKEGERYQVIKGGSTGTTNYIVDTHTSMIVTVVSEEGINEDLRRLLYFANQGNRGTRGAW